MEDAELIKLIRKGETQQMNMLIAKYYPDIYRYCYRYMGNVSDAQDITQDTFLSFCKNFDEYTHQNKCKNFLYVIAGNLCKNALSKKKSYSIDNMPEAALIGNDDFHAHDNEIALEAQLKALTFEQQELILLRYYQDLKFSEIANITNLSTSTVKYKLKNAIAALQTKLKKEDWI